MPALNNEQRMEMLRAYEINGFIPTRHFAERYDVTARTIRNTLHSMNIHHRQPAYKVDLTDAQKTAREVFAREYLDFDWSSTIFTDEKTFQSCTHGRLNLWRYNYTRYEEKNVKKNRESGRIGVNLWGWMSADGVGELVQLPPRANAVDYVTMLEESMLPSVRNVYPEQEMPNFSYVQDNCKIHTARITNAWFDRHPEITKIIWPAKSPDLNPIEHLWGLMVQRWDHQNERRVEALTHHCNQAWEDMRGTDICTKLVGSMHDRLLAVINNHGAYTRF